MLLLFSIRYPILPSRRHGEEDTAENLIFDGPLTRCTAAALAVLSVGVTQSKAGEFSLFYCVRGNAELFIVPAQSP